MTSTPECCAEKAAPISSKASVKEAAANITNGIPRGARSAEDPSVDGWVQLAANPSIRSTQINLSARGARIRAPPLAGTLCGFGCANLPPCGASSCQPREPIEHGTRLVNAERKQNLPKVIIAGCGGRRGASFELFEARATHLALCREQALNTRQVQQFEEAQFRQKDNPYGAQRRHRLTQPREKALAAEIPPKRHRTCFGRQSRFRPTQPDRPRRADNRAPARASEVQGPACRGGDRPAGARAGGRFGPSLVV